MGAKIWPTAPTWIGRYNSLISLIDNKRMLINNAANSANHQFLENAGYFVYFDDTLYGGYYDTYTERVKDWMKSGKSIEDRFIEYLPRLEGLRNEAVTQLRLWQYRDTLYEPDPPPVTTS